MTVHPIDLQTLDRTQAQLRDIDDHKRSQRHMTRSVRARIAAVTGRLGGRTGYVVAGLLGLLIVILAEYAV